MWISLILLFSLSFTNYVELNYYRLIGKALYLSAAIKGINDWYTDSYTICFSTFIVPIITTFPMLNIPFPYVFISNFFL